MLTNHLGRHVLENRQDAVDPIAGDQAGALALEQLSGKRIIAGTQGIFDRLVRQLVALAPACRRVQQVRRVAVPGQASLEKLGEQVMVAEPLALRVKRDDEQLLLLQTLQHLGAIVAPGKGVAQFGIELVEHRGLIEKVLLFLGQAVEHVFGQVVGDIALGSGQPGQEQAAVGMPRQSQCHEMQRSNPALSAGVQQIELGRAQLQLLELMKIRLGLQAREAQILGFDP
ncbi:hypothetical protein D9M68_635760 [compost metagenome]